jgi:hypothetical protein
MTHTCEICGTEIPYTKGRHPRWCLQHRSTKNRSRDLRRAAARGEVDAPSLDGRAPVGAAPEESRLAALAVLLAGGEPLRLAAQLAGFGGVDGAELQGLEERARAEHPQLVAGSTSALIGLAQQALALLLLALRDNARMLPPAVLASSLRQAGEILDRLQGGMAPVYSEVLVQVRLHDQPSPEVGGHSPAPVAGGFRKVFN